MSYSRTETHEGNDCLITKDAHVIPIYSSGSIVDYVATCSTIYTGWMGHSCDTAESKVFQDEDEAEKYCEEYFDDSSDEKNKDDEYEEWWE